MLSLETPLSDITSIKKPFLAKFKSLGIECVRDLLFHIPSRYDDYTAIKKISEALEEERATFEGVAGPIREKKLWHRKNMSVFETELSDDTGSIRLVWFNQKLVAENLKSHAKIRISGKVSSDRSGLVLVSPAFERSSRRPTHTARLVPVYPETYGLTSKFIRWQIETLFERKLAVSDPVPLEILERLHLPDLPRTLRMLHFPRTLEEVEIARKRLAFSDMLAIQLKVLELSALWNRERAVPFPSLPGFLGEIERAFPFSLTGAQRRAADEILADLERGIPMNRLVNGDVGSGKTAVAAIAASRVARENFQTAILAPTEVLARQHFETLRSLLVPFPFHIALLTRSESRLDGETISKETLKNAIRMGLADIAIGTHALLQKSVAFKNLALVVVDEQHRFGVAQRALLQEEAKNAEDGVPNRIPHLLTLSATPIPRTLAISLFGTLALSVLDELPENRTPITTKIAFAKEDRETVFRFARQEIKKGRQVFIILPLVEESAALSEVKAAKTEHEKLSRQVFPDRRVGLLYGKMKPKEKESAMNRFKAGELDVLVSTSVVEVGVDVPNATVMIIENADRFGLSQLHQFRGRVGRGAHPSFCFLLPGKDGSTNDRLLALRETRDGFALAEKDLELRGPGAFFGTRQSGIPDIAMSHLGNTRLIAIAQEEAKRLLGGDPALARHPLLRAQLDQLSEEVHLE